MADHRGERAVLAPRDQELKEAFAALVSAFGGNEAVGEAIGRPHQRISEWRNAALARFAPIDAVARLEACTIGLPGHPQVTRLLARRAGYVLAPRVAAHGEAGCDMMQALAAMTAELGDVSRAMMAARADGTVCQADARAILAECLALEEQMGALRGALEAMADGRRKAR